MIGLLYVLGYFGLSFVVAVLTNRYLLPFDHEFAAPIYIFLLAWPLALPITFGIASEEHNLMRRAIQWCSDRLP